MAQIPPEILQLRDTYEKAQIRLLDIIVKQESRGNVTVYRKAILAHTNAELKILDDFAAKWTKDNITKAYTQSVEDVYTAYRAAHISVPVIAANQKVIKSLSENASGQLLDAHRFIGRMVNDTIRQSGIEAIAEKVSTGSTVKETKKILIQKLTDKGIMAIKDKAGRNIKLEVYAETVARTTTRESTNLATINQMQAIGEDLVQMTNHSSSCPVCAVYEGRVYSISGKSKTYPSLDIPFSGDYANIHPRCSHSLTPYILKFDDNASDTKAFSNRSFDVNPQSKTQIDSYNKGQKIKADRRADRNEWETARLVAPDETPKTFSGFRSVKKTDGLKYKVIKEKMNAPLSGIASLSVEEKKVIEGYKQFGYAINETIRKRPGMRIDESAISYATDLKAILNKAKLAKELQVYRGVGTQALVPNKNLRNLVIRDPSRIIGTEISDSAFMSTSASKDVARRFIPTDRGTYGDTVLLEIRVPKGYNALEFGDFSLNKEEEVLLKHGSKLKITGFEDTRKHGTPKMIEVDDTTKPIGNIDDIFGVDYKKKWVESGERIPGYIKYICEVVE